jgi:hypothetical protein
MTNEEKLRAALSDAIEELSLLKVAIKAGVPNPNLAIATIDLTVNFLHVTLDECDGVN